MPSGVTLQNLADVVNAVTSAGGRPSRFDSTFLFP